MEYSNGMGIEMPVWVIQSPSGKRTFNRKTRLVQIEVTEDCIFPSPEEAYEQLKYMDYGYKVVPKRHYLDSQNNRIW